MSRLALADVGTMEPVQTTLKFDRRASERAPADGFAMIAFGPEHAPRLIPVSLRDVSHGGMGVWSCRDEEPGTPFVVYANGAPCPTMRGEVARCKPESGGGYFLGLCHQHLCAA